ncbi:hypothetical protein AcV5_007338 [Taiwanofungus camphoratus]|nr:hypothetical protein AcV5_007338 [Antrodia cinnamomea]
MGLLSVDVQVILNIIMSKHDRSMPDQLSLPSDPSSPSPTSCEDTPLSPTITVSSPAPQEMDSAIDGVFKLATKSMSCSEFARRSAESRDDIPVFEWLFDRNAVVLSVLHDQEMQQKYDRIAQFIWPSKWKRLGDLPNVDENVRFLLHDLTKQVLLAERGGNLDLSTTPDIPEDIFPLLVGSFSAIFQACKHSQIKAHSSGTVPEAAWRHDHDRLFFDFFNNAGDGKYSLSVGLDEFQSQSVSQSGDASSPSDHAENSDSSNPPVYPSLGRLLWLPGSNLIDKEGTHKETELDDLTRFLRRLEMSKGTLESWVAKSEQYRATKFLEDRDQGYIQFQAFTWQEQCSRDHLLARLGEAPTKGVCDALGTLRVIIDVPHKLLDNVRLASLDPPKRSYLESKIEESKGEKEKQPAKRSRAGRTRSERRSEVTSSDRLTTPEGGVETSQDYKYNILASTKRTPVTQDLLHKDTDMVSELATQMSRLKVSVLPKGPSESILELPLIFAEYKKATTTVAQGTNQHRMYCVAAARFLESLGITNYPIFSVVTDGPQAVLASAWTKQGRVYIFERHTQSFDISTAIGAWHYATVLCRIAVWQSRELYAKFAEVKDELVQRLKGSDKTLRWKMKHQLETLDASNVAKRPPRAKNQKKDEE